MVFNVQYDASWPSFKNGYRNNKFIKKSDKDFNQKIRLV